MNQPHVLIIDAGLGNIGSVFKAFQREYCTVVRLRKPPPPEELDLFTHVVLPGVGSFYAGMEALKRTGWHSWIKESWRPTVRPFLGICLGMQLLATEGIEGVPNNQLTDGLDIIPGSVLPFEDGYQLVLPHVGWNSISWSDLNSPLSLSIPEGGDMYYVHSYVFSPHKSEYCLASTDYGQSFSSIVALGTCFGVQFHPEKSQRLGRQLLKNFLSLSPC